MKALQAPVFETLEGQYQRRDNAIEAIVAYCSIEEGPTVRSCRMSSTTSVSRENGNEPSEDDPLFLVTMSVFLLIIRNKGQGGVSMHWRRALIATRRLSCGKEDWRILHAWRFE
jgi:hypothetical protein